MLTQRQLCVEPTELMVKTADVKDRISFDSCEIVKLKIGYLFTAKGGMSTYVSPAMGSVYTMLNTLFELRDSNDEGASEAYDAFASAVIVLFQTPIMASLSEKSFIDTAIAVTKIFNENCDALLKKPLKEETPEDAQLNAEYIETEKELEKAQKEVDKEA